LNNLILLRNHRTTKIKDLNAASYFAVLPGYDTLRYILCRKAILVEGASDELVVQRAYRDNHDGKLPIEDGIDVIAVQGLSFLRYLEIADKLHIKTAIVSDNDGDYEAVKRKYVDYLGDNKKEYVDICIDSNIDTGDLKIGNKQFNYNTLEPKLLKENSIQLFNDIFGKSYKNEEELFNYMQKNKTECALKIFNSSQKIKYPNYIMKAVKSDE
jgi:putative ATP-dependent endonuclease of OLD family